jgi:hypothetical protein
MRPFFFIIIFFIKFGSMVSQNIAVFDKNSKRSIPYATVHYMAKEKIIGGDYCDGNGYLKTNTTLNYDKIALSCMGYKSASIDKITKGLDSVFLSNEAIELDEVVISKRSTNNTSLLGYSDFRKNNYLGMGKHIEQVVYVKNPNNKAVPIVSFLFKVKKIKHKTVIRVCFYKKAIQTFEPGLRMESNDIIAELNSNTEGLVEVDVSKHALLLPIDGAFIGFDVVDVIDDKTGIPFEYSDLPNALLSFEYTQNGTDSFCFSRNRFQLKPWYNDNDRNYSELSVLYKKPYKSKKMTLPSFGIKVTNE